MDENKKIQLFLDQKQLLDTFLKTHAISKDQYNTSLNGLIEKMGIDPSLLGECKNEKEKDEH